MKRTSQTILLFSLIGALIIGIRCSQSRGTQSPEPDRWEVFPGKSFLNATFEYPVGSTWRPIQLGNGYMVAVDVGEPPDELVLAVSVMYLGEDSITRPEDRDPTEIEQTLLDLATSAGDARRALLNQVEAAIDTNLIRDDIVKVADKDAIELIWTIRSSDNGLTYRHRWLLIDHEEKVYALSIVSQEEDLATFSNPIEHFVETFRFNEDKT